MTEFVKKGNRGSFAKAGQWIGSPEQPVRPTVNGENVGAFLASWKAMRQKARTDLLFLCNHVLGYVDVNQDVHGPIVEALQKFEGWNDPHHDIKDVNKAFGARKLLGATKCPMWELKGRSGGVAETPDRKNLFLFPRGHLKTTVITIAHSIQWIINYPDIRILISSGTEDQAQGFLKEIRGHFSSTEMFRFLFPEFCLADGSQELGNMDQFTIPCRPVKRKEPTARIATVGKSMSGGHYDVIKNDDLVDKENCRTPSQIEDVKFHFGMLRPLLETNALYPKHGWSDVAGTRYNFSDLYGAIISTEQKRVMHGGQPEYNIVERSAAPNWPKGPFLWPSRMGYKELKSIEDSEVEGPAVLFPQYLMRPIVAGQGLITDIKEISWVPRSVINDLYPRYSLYAALDLAGMDTGSLGLDNDYSCLAVGGFQRDGRLDVIDVWHGRPSVFDVIEWIFAAFKRHPRLIKLKIEKEAHARVLLPFLQREQAKRGLWLPLSPQPRDNQQSKQSKIKGSQPWFQSQGIRFADDLACKSHLQTEIMGFPKYRHDDILDTVVDLMHERDGINADVMGRAKYTPGQEPMPAYLDPEVLQDHIFGVAGHGIDEKSAVDYITGF